jgi:hypothetical protein
MDGINMNAFKNERNPLPLGTAGLDVLATGRENGE